MFTSDLSQKFAVNVTLNLVDFCYRCGRKPRKLIMNVRANTREEAIKSVYDSLKPLIMQDVEIIVD